MTQVASSTGPLRERRRLQTMKDVHAAAFRLAREHGFDKVTVDMIAAEAGVSRRTFFNYFPGKEAAVLSVPPELPAELVAEFVAAGPAHPRQVLADLVRVLVADLAAAPPQLQDFRDMFEAGHANPQLHASLSAGLDSFRRQLADMVARRLGQKACDQVPGMVAGVALATVFSAMEHWAAGGACGESPVPYLERSAGLLRELLALDTPGGAL